MPAWQTSTMVDRVNGKLRWLVDTVNIRSKMLLLVRLSSNEREATHRASSMIAMQATAAPMAVQARAACAAIWTTARIGALAAASARLTLAALADPGVSRRWPAAPFKMLTGTRTSIIVDSQRPGAP
ncbi:hypothetical protein [Krasilnikovia sp. M28-CT-15]|uniref:hypothetical protein n=1 Tax=Krasilnikovia sp. M28-CT-15 TaxID=3373540 RepID=UPI00399D4C03